MSRHQRWQTVQVSRGQDERRDVSLASKALELKPSLAQRPTVVAREALCGPGQTW